MQEPAHGSGPARGMVVSGRQVVALETPVSLGGCCDGDLPRIEVVPAGPGLVTIHVFCRCGERIALECETELPTGGLRGAS